MAPSPKPHDNGSQSAVASYMSAGQESGTRLNTISLGVLIDFIAQRTFHDLTVLSELLPRKTDMERKVEIYNFAARTRCLFIRLITLVKWANSVSKVDKSANIMSFLDKQNMLFVETADVLARVSRDTLVRARLPNFHIPAAVEVMTTGTYNRLPSCIRDRILPPEPITTVEKKQTLVRLNQVIQHRLVNSKLPPQMNEFKIRNGRVYFEVKHEFSVSLTVMSDAPDVPWRLLDINILVEDKEIGDGKPLAHPLQVNYIHQLIQVRLNDNPNAIAEVYNMLHFFCQSLQLEVLYTQTLRLNFDRLDDNINVEEYVPGVKLIVSYWRELASKDSKSELGYRLIVQADSSTDGRPLTVVHIPSLPSKDTYEIMERAVRSEILSMERLIVHTVYVRSFSRLSDLRVEFQSFLKDIDCNVQGTPAILTVPVLSPCLRAEQIHITVDTHTGMLHCHVPKHLDCPIMAELQSCLNNNDARLPQIISELRFWITHRRCEKTLQHLPATAIESLPFLTPPDIPLLKAGRHKIFVKLHRHPSVILIVRLKEKPNKPNEIDYTFHLGFINYIPREVEQNTCKELALPGMLPPQTQAAQFNMGFPVAQTMQNMSTNGGASQTSVSKFMNMMGNPMSAMAGNFATNSTDGSNCNVYSDAVPKPYVHLVRIIEFDTFVATHGRDTDVDDISPYKRKMNGDQGPPQKQAKTIYPAYFIPELAHVVAMCDEKIPFLSLAQEFTRHNIPHSGVHVEYNANAMALKLFSLPRPPSGIAAVSSSNGKRKQLSIMSNNMESDGENLVGMAAIFADVNTSNFPVIEDCIWEDLMKRLISVSIRSQMNKNNQLRIWVVEIVFGDTILPSLHSKEQGNRRTVYLTYEQTNNDFSKTVLDLLKDWSKIVYLYTLVYNFAEFYSSSRFNLSDIVNIQSYSFLNLLLGYGPKKELSCNIYWSSQTCAFRLIFIGGISAINAHSMMREALSLHLNSRYNLIHIVYLLHETYAPLGSIAKLQIVPLLGVLRPQVPILSYCILTQSPSLVRVAFQSLFCLEIRLLANKHVSVRDGAYSRFDRSLVNDFTPIQGLKGFLNKYVDENSLYRGYVTNDDDNPPSPPLAVEDGYNGPGSVSGATSTGGSSPFLGAGLRGPQSPRDCGLRFSTPHTPPSSSNPHTPASPHPAVGPPSVHNNFNLTSPPAPHLPHPSPGSLMPSSPLNPQPSPHMVHSPGPNTLYMQNHQDSPFTAMSPANTNWPGSPMPRPSPRPGQSPDHKSAVSAAQSAISRANRSWAGAVPTLITHEAFDLICRPCQHPNKDIVGPDCSPLDRFLGCVYMRRQLQRIVQNDDSLQSLNSIEPGVVLFKVDGFQCQVTLNPVHMQSLHLKLTQLALPDGKSPYLLSLDDLMVLEQFFDLRVVAPPYRANCLSTFCRILNIAPQVQKDFVQIMRLDLKPDLGGDQMKWTVQFCMRVPPSATPIVPIGGPGVLICRLKILFFLQITRIPYNGKDWKDSPTLVLPMVYDIQTNITQLAERREPGQSHGTAAANALLRRFLEYGNQHGQCSLFPAVRDLLMNLQLPNDMPPMPHPSNQVMGVANVGGVGGNAMMHTPMQQMGSVGSNLGVGGGVVPGIYSQITQPTGMPPGSQ